MIADRLFERFPIDAIFGLHNHPGMPAGTLLTRPGPMMAAGDTVKITITGKGGHASRPHLTVDPILVACNLVMTLQSIVSRNVDPTQTAVVTVSTIHAGEASNVIPNTPKISVSVRSFDPGIRTFLEERIRKLTATVAEGHGATAEIDYEHGSCCGEFREGDGLRAGSGRGTDRFRKCLDLPSSARQRGLCVFPRAQARQLFAAWQRHGFPDPPQLEVRLQQ